MGDAAAVANVFISYARSTAAAAGRIADALQQLGYSVWRDDALPAHRTYAEVIEERLAAADAVVVLWSDEAVRSHWVGSEADRARQDGKIVQVRVDGARLPMPFDQIQCADLIGWSGDADAPGWRKALDSIRTLAGEPTRAPQAQGRGDGRQASICVLPFANMSGDPEQDYFSDGVCEDVITDLSKVSALFVVARNTSFTLKGKAVDVQEVARRLNVSHVLEGSVRKSGRRVRITAQLINGASGGHVWGERYDRDFDDIFALQDEISQAIVGALRLKLLPEEKRAIEQRGTTNAAAYKLYLMARQFSAMGNERHLPIIARLCRKAAELDPGYAQAWAQLAIVQSTLDVRPGSAPGGDEAAARA